MSAFTFYASLGGSSPYHMPLNAFTTFLDDAGIPEADSAAVKRSDCDTLFIVCNFQPDKRSAEAAVNDEHALMRYEFLEAVVRLGEWAVGVQGLCGGRECEKREHTQRLGSRWGHCTCPWHAKCSITHFNTSVEPVQLLPSTGAA